MSLLLVYRLCILFERNHVELKFYCDKYPRQLAKFIAEAYDIRKNVIFKPNV